MLKMAWNDLGIVRNIFGSHFVFGNSLRSPILGPKTDISFFFENLNFQCSSITHFLSHKIEDPSCRICSYGPQGPFWFSVKNRRDMVKRYQKT